MKRIRDDAMIANDGQSRLYGALIDEVVETLERQLPEMTFLQNISRSSQCSMTGVTNAVGWCI